MIVAEVYLWNRRIGAVSVDQDSGYHLFAYDPQFILSNIQVSPIMMPLSSDVYQFNTLEYDTFKGLPGLLADSLPDKYGNAILDGWLAANGRTKESFNSIERLCYIGERGMGALEFRPSRDLDFGESDEIDVNKLVELSNEILNHKESITVKDKDRLVDIIKVGTSAGGARAKAIIAYNEKTGVVKSGQINAGKDFTYWILKLGGVTQDQEEENFTRREFAYYLMAKEAGINMMESRLLSIDNMYHFMTKRFDRIIMDDGTLMKVHMQTLGALTHVSYNNPGLMSYEEVSQIMYDLGVEASENKEFFRRMVFNIMAINRDDHVKNISFLMDQKGKWSLSPAYDVTFAYNPEGRYTFEHQMRVNGKTKDISKTDILKAAKTMNIREKHALIIIDEIQSALGKWRTFAKEAKLDDITIDEIEKMFIRY
jgi:serine/threonine-protein kinase HipA